MLQSRAPAGHGRSFHPHSIANDDSHIGPDNSIKLAIATGQSPWILNFAAELLFIAIT
jgi:hypothetical protein